MISFIQKSLSLIMSLFSCGLRYFACMRISDALATNWALFLASKWALFLTSNWALIDTKLMAKLTRNYSRNWHNWPEINASCAQQSGLAWTGISFTSIFAIILISVLAYSLLDGLPI